MKKLLGLVFLTFATFLGACSPRGDVAGTVSSRQSAIAYASNDSVYFSPNSIDSLHIGWYSSELYGMREPTFHDAFVPANTTVLRFLWIRAFDPAVAVRVILQQSHCSVVTTMLEQSFPEFGPPDSLGISTQIGVLKGAISRQDSVETLIEDCRRLSTEFESGANWSRGREDPSVGIDGSEWCFEILDAAGHRAFSYWTPNAKENATLWQAGTHALSLARALPVSPRYVY